MWFSRKQKVKPAQLAAESNAPESSPDRPRQRTTKARGDAGEAAALAYLLRHGMKLVETNYRTPGRGGGEIDIVMRAGDGTLVFVEVRQRAGTSHGGAAASIGAIKRQRIVFAARHYLMRFASPPPCRFDVVLMEGTAAADKPQQPTMRIEWLVAAFDAS